MLRPPLHVRPDRRRRRVEDRDAVALDDRPPPVLVGEVRRALVQHRRGAVAERPVDDVGVPRHPADVGRAPVDVVGLQVEHVVVRRRDADEVAGGRVRDALRLRGRAGGVEEVEQILGIHRLGRAVRLVGGELVPPVVAALGHRHVVAGAPQDDHVADAGRLAHRLVGRALERHGRAAAPCLVLRDQHLALHVLQPARQRVRREPAEDDGVRRAEPRAREHRDRRLRNHPQVDADRRSLANAERAQRVGELRHLAQQVGVRQVAALTVRLALPVIGDGVAAAGLDVLVETVPRDVELAAEVPLRVRRLPLVQLRERLEPADALAPLALPERLEGLVVDPGLPVRLRRERGRRRVAPLLEEQRVDRVGHGARSYGYCVRFSAPSSVTSTRSSSLTPP